VSFDYKRAIKKVVHEELKGNNPIPDILGFQHLKPLYEDKLSDILDSLFANYKSNTKNPLPLLKIDVPKPNFTIRPMSRPENKDWFLYEAIVDSLASKIIPDDHICKRSFSYLNYLPSTAKENNWIKFDDKCRELYSMGFKHAVIADLTGYYENISLSELKKRLSNYLIVDEETDLKISVLCKLLHTWSDERVSDYGLPQGPPASSFLADIYLDFVDSKMEKYENYYRYMDDIKIFCKTEIEAKKALKDLIIALRDIKLNINAKKTKILHGTEIASLLFDPLKASLSSIDSILKSKNRTQVINIISSLQIIFANAFVDNLFEKTHLTFALYRLSKLHSSGFALNTEKIIALIIENFVSKPHHAGLFCFFLTLFQNNIEIVRFLIKYLQSDNNIYDWQEIRVLQSLLRLNVKLGPSDIKFFITSGMNSNKHFAARAFYFLLVGKYGNNRERDLVIGCYNVELNSYIKTAIILSVQELGKDSRNDFYAWIRKYETDKEVIEFLSYVKSLKYPLYCLDIPRPTLEGLEDIEPSPYY